MLFTYGKIAWRPKTTDMNGVKNLILGEHNGKARNKYVTLIFSFAFIILLFSIWNTKCAAETQILKGTHEVVYDITSAKKIVLPPAVHTATFTQEILKYGKNSFRLRVTSALAPVNFTSLFPVDAKNLPAEIQPYLAHTKKIQTQNAHIQSIAKKQTSAAHFQWEAAASIIGWVKDNLTYDMTLSFPVDAVSTLKNKTSRCEGYTNLSLALLRAAGIPSRAVTYFTVPGHGWGVVPGQGGMHSALEVYYPDAGWLAYDPQGTLHYVDPYHIYLFSEVDDEGSQFLYEGTSENNMKLVKGREDYKNLYEFFNDPSVSIATVSDNDETFVWDMLPSPKNIVNAAPVNNTLNFSTLYGKVVNAAAGTPLSSSSAKAWVYLWSGGKGKGYSVNANGVYSIPGLSAEEYVISAKAELYAESEKQTVILKEKSALEVNFSLSKGGSLSGKLTAADGKNLSAFIVGISQAGKAPDGSFSYAPYDVKPDGSFHIDDLPAGTITFVVVNKNTGLLAYEKPIAIVPGKELVLTITLP